MFTKPTPKIFSSFAALKNVSMLVKNRNAEKKFGWTFCSALWKQHIFPELEGPMVAGSCPKALML